MGEVGPPPLSLWSDSNQTKPPVSQGDVIWGPHPPAWARSVCLYVGVIKLSHDSWELFGSIHALRQMMCVYHAQVKMLTHTNSSEVTQTSETHIRCHFF